MRAAAVFRVGVSFAFVLGGLLITPAMAYKWPGDGASVGSVLSAKIIGQQCQGVLSASEIAELDAYLAKAASEWAADAANAGFSFEKFVSGLSADYAAKFRDPKACDGDATEEAQDTLQRVRKAMATGKPVLGDRSDPNRRPDVGEVIEAKIVAEKCDTALTALEWAELELYLARDWVALGKSSGDEDARRTFKLYKSSEKDIAEAWRAKDCTDAAIKNAKTVSGLVRKALDASAR
jgi:hypothetical protein